MNFQNIAATLGSDRRNRALALIVLVLSGLAWLPGVDAVAEATVDSGMKRAAVAFAVARGLNAVISMVQGTEISVGIGIDASVSVGEVLDPVNDLVETFGDVMLVAAVSFALQKLLLLIGGSTVVKIFLSFFALGWAASLWFKGRAPRFLSGALILLVMARFAVPVAAAGGDWIYRSFLAVEDDTAVASLEDSRRDLKVADDQFNGAGPPTVDDAATRVPGAGTGDPEKLRCGWFDLKCKAEATRERIGQWFDVKGRVDALKAKAEGMVEDMIRLMASFLFQTVLMPVGFIWLALVAVRATVRWSVGQPTARSPALLDTSDATLEGVPPAPSEHP